MTPILAIKIITAIANCFYVYLMMILVRCLLTWLPGIDWNNFFFKALRESVDLYLDLFKKWIPPFGPFDFSPVVASFALIFIRNIIVYGALYLFAGLGLLG